MRKEIIVGISTALGTTLILYLAGKITQFPTILVPSKAVVAFHAASCPDGWKEVKFAKGRFIIGVGESPGLTNRTLLEKGGEEQHKLTIEEMPKHKHVKENIGLGKEDEYGFQGSERNVYISSKKMEPISEEQGKDKPHNNMPPYVALLYCEKE
jgi:hypothetical protein